MRYRDPKVSALRFNEAINCRDLKALEGLMTADHALVCYGSLDASGRDASLDAWRGFFEAYPRYVNIMAVIVSNGDLVAMAGRSECPREPELEGPALWSARVEDSGLLSEWRVWRNTPEDRRLRGLPARD